MPGQQLRVAHQVGDRILLAAEPLATLVRQQGAQGLLCRLAVAGIVLLRESEPCPGALGK